MKHHSSKPKSKSNPLRTTLQPLTPIISPPLVEHNTSTHFESHPPKSNRQQERNQEEPNLSSSSCTTQRQQTLQQGLKHEEQVIYEIQDLETTLFSFSHHHHHHHLHEADSGSTSGSASNSRSQPENHPHTEATTSHGHGNRRTSREDGRKRTSTLRREDATLGTEFELNLAANIGHGFRYGIGGSHLLKRDGEGGGGVQRDWKKARGQDEDDEEDEEEEEEEEEEDYCEERKKYRRVRLGDLCSCGGC
ncbi:hypothetical protein BKA64DRAFT_642708 [Cadophora sp. MPI-SDFR-AT-0126]|nr:hypothetical protein BKA64DRAFT_642708 [Leotiomycetes sp. MPI-SDFR-AT-0126]